jgi:hypothetical protein
MEKVATGACISVIASRPSKTAGKKFGPGLLNAMLAQLGLTKADLES